MGFEPGGLMRTQRIMELLPEVLRPRSLRRDERCEEALEEFGTFMFRLADLQFDPSLGASGRPRASHERKAGPPSQRPGCTPIRVRGSGEWPTVQWDGSSLMIKGTDGRERSFSCVGAAGTGERETARSGWLTRFTWLRWPRPQVAELVWLETAPGTSLRVRDRGTDISSLLLLDGQGFRLLTLADIDFSWSDIAQVAGAAGLPIVGYSLPCRYETAARIGRLLFPRRLRHRKVLGWWVDLTE